MLQLTYIKYRITSSAAGATALSNAFCERRINIEIRISGRIFGKLAITHEPRV
jgi:hypothetical protein